MERLLQMTFQNVNNVNKNSESNGSLMRSTPLAVYGHRLNREELMQIVTLDCNFTHCHKNVIDAVYLYCLAIGVMITECQNEDRAKAAIN